MVSLPFPTLVRVDDLRTFTGMFVAGAQSDVGRARRDRRTRGTAGGGVVLGVRPAGANIVNEQRADEGTAPARRRNVVFGRDRAKGGAVRTGAQDELVDRLMNAGEVERRQLLLEALQSGQLKKSESADLIRLVERLESVSRQGD
jgi:hypothetical protein